MLCYGFTSIDTTRGQGIVRVVVVLVVVVVAAVAAVVVVAVVIVVGDLPRCL